MSSNEEAEAAKQLEKELGTEETSELKSEEPGKSAQFLMTPLDVAQEMKRLRAQIDSVKLMCSTELSRDPEVFDDLFILRFLLSYKEDPKTAAGPLLETIEWRMKNHEKLKKIHDGGAPPHNEIMSKLMTYAVHKETRAGEPIMLLRAGVANLSLLMDSLPREAVDEWFIFSKEALFAECDRRTRKTGKIIKMVSIMDFNYLKLTRCSDRRFSAAIGNASKATEKFYPQLLGISVFVNNPMWLKIIIAISKLFCSPKTFAKIKICKGKTLAGMWNGCPFADQYFDPADVPTFLGGTCNCPGGCIPGIPNDQKEIIYAKKKKGEELGTLF